MATPQHESGHGKEYIEQPSMDPAQQSNEAKHHHQPAAEFPAEAADDMGQLWAEQEDSYPFSEELSEEAGPEGDNAAQRGGSGPRLDDLGIRDLSDKDELGKQDLPMLNKLARTDLPVFDRSLDERDPDEPDNGDRPDQTAKLEDRPEANPEALDEDITPYDISLDGPGTDDLR